MLEGLEKGWTDFKWTPWKRVAFLFNLTVATFYFAVLMFVPTVFNSGQHKLLRWVLILLLIALNLSNFFSHRTKPHDRIGK